MKRTVFLLVPLRGNVRVQRCEVVFACERLPSGADRTARAEGRPRIHRRAPRMAFRTAPPDELVAAGRHILRRQRRVLLDVPLCREQRKLLHQAALFRRNLAPCAVGATCALATGVDHRLPRVTASGVSGKFCSISHWAIKVVFPCSVQNARNVRRIVSHPLAKKAPFQQSRTEQ